MRLFKQNGDITYQVYQILMLNICILIMRIGWFASIPFITLFLLKDITQNPIVIGVITGSGFLAVSFGGVISGVLSDRYSAKYLMIVSLFFSALLFFLFSLSVSKIILFVLIINFGLGLMASMFLVANSSYLAKQIACEYKIHVYNLRYTMINLAGAIGPIIGIWFFSHSSTLAFKSAAILYIITLIVIMLVIPQDNKLDNKNILFNESSWYVFKLVLKHQKITLLVILGMVVNFAFTQITITIPQVLNIKFTNTPQLLGILLSINGITIITLQMAVGAMINKIKIKLKYVGYLASIFLAIAFVGFAFSDKKIIWIMNIIIFTVGEILYFSIINLIIENISNKYQELKGTYFGVANMALVGGFLGGVVGGIALKYANYQILYLGISILLLTTMPLYNRVIEK